MIAGRYQMIEHEGDDLVTARDTQENSRVTVETISTVRVRVDPDLAQRVLAALHQIVNPHIVPIRDIIIEPGQCTIVSDFVPGRTLAQVISQESVSLDQAGDILSQVAETLVLAQQQQTSHGALSPHDIIVSAAGNVFVRHLGLRAALRSAGVDPLAGREQPYSGLNANGGDPEPARSDLFSLGAIAYQIAAGFDLEGGEVPVQQMFGEFVRSATPPSEINPNVPEVWDRLIVRMVSMDADDRFTSLSDAAAVLRSMGKRPDCAKTAPPLEQPGEVAPPHQANEEVPFREQPGEAVRLEQENEAGPAEQPVPLRRPAQQFVRGGWGEEIPDDGEPVIEGRKKWRIAVVAAVMFLALGGGGVAAFFLTHTHVRVHLPPPLVASSVTSGDASVIVSGEQVPLHWNP